MPMYGTIINYVAWYVFMFISVMWLLILLRNWGRPNNLGSNNSWFPVVSVLVPAYNEEQYLEKTLKSLLSLDYPKRMLDIIVVNDCSKDRTRKIAESFGKEGVRVLNNSVNMGKAASLNRAIPLCRGEFVACIDADSTVEPDILKKMTSYFKNPVVASVTPALKVENPRNMLEKAQYAEYILNIFLRKMLAFIDSVHVTPGVFSVYRKSVLQEIGGFDNDNLTEDMEIALRIHEAGYTIENNMNAISYTACPDRFRELYKQRVRWYRGAVQNAVKYKHMLFNRKYGNLGVFFLPFNLIAIVAIVAIFFLLSVNYVMSFIDYVWKFSLVNWDIMSFIPKSISMDSVFIYLVNTPLVLWAFGSVMALSLLLVSFRLANEKISIRRFSYFLYIFIFPFIYMFLWAVALVFEAAGRKRVW